VCVVGDSGCITHASDGLGVLLGTAPVRWRHCPPPTRWLGTARQMIYPHAMLWWAGRADWGTAAGLGACGGARTLCAAAAARALWRRAGTRARRGAVGRSVCAAGQGRRPRPVHIHRRVCARGVGRAQPRARPHPAAPCGAAAAAAAATRPTDPIGSDAAAPPTARTAPATYHPSPPPAPPSDAVISVAHAAPAPSPAAAVAAAGPGGRPGWGRCGGSRGSGGHVLCGRVGRRWQCPPLFPQARAGRHADGPCDVDGRKRPWGGARVATAAVGAGSPVAAVAGDAARGLRAMGGVLGCTGKGGMRQLPLAPWLASCEASPSPSLSPKWAPRARRRLWVRSSGP
jgi:hypothetical protein